MTALSQYMYVIVGWEVRTGKNCDQGLENATSDQAT